MSTRSGSHRPPSGSGDESLGDSDLIAAANAHLAADAGTGTEGDRQSGERDESRLSSRRSSRALRHSSHSSAEQHSPSSRHRSRQSPARPAKHHHQSDKGHRRRLSRSSSSSRRSRSRTPRSRSRGRRRSSSSSSSSTSSSDSSRSAASESKTETIVASAVPPAAITIDLKERAGKYDRLKVPLSSLKKSCRRAWTDFSAGYNMLPERRKEYFEALPVIDSPLATAPHLDVAMSATLLRMGKKVPADDARMANKQQLALEILMTQVCTAQAIAAGDTQGAMTTLVEGMRLTGVLVQDLTGDRRYGILKQIVRQPPQAMPSLRSAPISSRTMSHNGKDVPRLFGHKLIHEFSDSAKVGAAAEKAAKAVNSAFGAGTSSNHRRHSNPSDRNRSATLLHQYGLPIPSVRLQHAPYLLAGRLSFFLSEWRTITSDPWVLQCILGYSLDFVSTPPSQQAQPRPIAFDPDDCTLIGTEVASMLSKGAIEAIPSNRKPFLWLSRIFFVPKKPTGIRPIINLRPLNRFIRYKHFKMEGLPLLADLIVKNDWLAKIDMKDAYFCVNIAQQSRDFLAFQWQDTLYRFTALPFGLASSPRVYTKLMRPVAAFLRTHGIRCVVYLDDWCFLASSAEQLESELQFAISVFERLGLVINYPKSVLQPTQQLVFLGLIIDTTTLKFLVPEEKLTLIENEATSLQKAAHCTLRALATFLGRLTSVSLAVLPVPLYSRYLQWDLIDALHKNEDYTSSCRLSPDALSELQQWSTDLRVWNGRLIHPRPIDHSITTDASKLGYGAWCGESSTGGRWTLAESKEHINVLELIAAFIGLKCFAAHLRNVHILLRIDNSVAIAYLNAQGGNRNRQLNGIAKQIWEWCFLRKISFKAVHIPGKLNVLADYESRHFADVSDWKLDPSLVTRIFQRWPGAQIDLFASRSNCQLARFYSWRPDPEAEAIDSFTQKWSPHCVYAFPPFALIGRTLQKLAQDNAEMILVVPWWPSQSWWPTLIRSAVDIPVFFPPRPGLLLDPMDTTHPLVMRGSLVLSAWRVSGIIGRVTAFQAHLLSCYHHPGRTPLPGNIIQHSTAGSLGALSTILMQRARQM